MPMVTQEIMIALCAVLRPLPIGTNLALLHVMWQLVSGKLLNSRGALFPRLLSSGLSAVEGFGAARPHRYTGATVSGCRATCRRNVTHRRDSPSVITLRRLPNSLDDKSAPGSGVVQYQQREYQFWYPTR